MRTLTTSITSQTSAEQSGWCELYDFYLPAAINTPFGNTATLRVTTLAGGLNFFTPTQSPEPGGTQGGAAAYAFWPMKRKVARGSTKFSNDKVVIGASNVTGEWAQMLADVDWEAVAVVIRKVSTTVANPTAADCAVIFSGNVDTAKITLEQLQFTCSNDLGAFNVSAPRENMHANCRFTMFDDQCTLVRYLTGHYKTCTVGSGSSATDIKSADLTDDTGASGSYGTDLIAALADSAITASSDLTSLTNVPATWLFNVNFGYFYLSSGTTLPAGTAVTFAATTMPGGLTAGTTYYIAANSPGNPYFLSATLGGPRLHVTSSGSNVTLSTIQQFTAPQVKSTNPSGGYWQFNNSADWGVNTEGYWQIPDAQAGVANGTLTPWIQFDLGASPPAPKLWQARGRNDSNTDLEQLPRLIQFFSNPGVSVPADLNDPTKWVLESHYEMPAIIGPLFDVLIPKASANRYWRICVRTRWSDTLRFSLFSRVSAYAGSRNWWQDGQITFASSTTTTALRNITRTVRESYSGELICAALPVAPVSGDTFVIEKGCARTFNACAARKNVENFGGFNTLPYETVVR